MSIKNIGQTHLDLLELVAEYENLLQDKEEEIVKSSTFAHVTATAEADLLKVVISDLRKVIRNAYN